MKRRILFLSLILVVSAYFTIIACASTTDITMELNKSEYVGFNDIISVKLTAPGLNSNAKQVDYLLVQVYTSENPMGMYVYITETSKDSGIFSGNITFSANVLDPRSKILKVINATNLYIKYQDTVAEASWRPAEMKIALDKATYSGYGVIPVITITNNDLNLNKSVEEEIPVKVVSTSDPTGINLKLLEKSPDSGIFTASFSLDRIVSDDKAKRLRISHNDTITVIHEALSSSTGKLESWKASANWKPSTGVVKLSKSSYSGLLSTGSVTITDQDLNLRSEYFDTAQVRITSTSDPLGIILSAYETGENKGVFSAGFSFSTYASDSGKGTIKVSPTDEITATYIDGTAGDNTSNVPIATTADFKMEEAKIETSAKDDEGIGNMLDIYIIDPDANNPKIKDRIIAKVGSADKTDELTIWLEETGVNVGKFRCKLYLNEEKLTANSLLIAPTDKINIKYVDVTVPKGDKKELIKTVDWTYQSTVLKIDSDSYTGYNNSAKISLLNMTLNKDGNKKENVDVKVRTLSSGNITLELEETGVDSGEFTGSLYFGKSSKRSDRVVGVSGSDVVTVTFVNDKDEDDFAECTAKWFAQNAEITLDRNEYKGNGAPVKITLKDWDIADDSKEKDEVKVGVRIKGSTKDSTVTLTETNKNSGVFSGTFYINGKGDQRPSITLKPGDMIEVLYDDKDTSSGAEESRIATASWIGISKAELTLNKQEYIGYDTYMTINLVDPDQNKSTSARDKVTFQIKTKSGKTKEEYTTTETGSDTGIFTLKLKLSADEPSNSRIRVMPSDEITVTFEDKNISATATFSEK
ncbi:MAG TPA: hypothetical protein VD757_00065 [Candidatus Nitrosocosmicus sp.]|nr:hypothetical protein [Candidatus Nitrosocosmicus sp.]